MSRKQILSGCLSLCVLAGLRPGRAGTSARPGGRAGPDPEGEDLRRDLPAHQRIRSQLLLLHAGGGQAPARHPDHRRRADEREEPLRATATSSTSTRARPTGSRSASSSSRSGSGPRSAKLGTVMERHGRARIVRLDDGMATAKVEKGCGTIKVGDFLLPFEEGRARSAGTSATATWTPTPARRARSSTSRTTSTSPAPGSGP
ncbi:MAG: hypothetical protein M0C28_14505 [Candidatus Moduliflexus flocculans]|nr:hypothetical protein [Candidatus Moduliflexus flocculans]